MRTIKVMNIQGLCQIVDQPIDIASDISFERAQPAGLARVRSGVDGKLAEQGRVELLHVRTTLAMGKKDLTVMMLAFSR